MGNPLKIILTTRRYVERIPESHLKTSDVLSVATKFQIFNRIRKIHESVMSLKTRRNLADKILS
jgi:hypothetical protein